MSAEMIQTTDDSDDLPTSQTVVSSSIVIPSTSSARRSSRYDEDQHSKRRANEDSKRSLEENKRPRLNVEDGEFKKRGQRMFGMILGTLTKFKNDSQNKSEA
ncbi:14071_t:CDS:2, partial [Ambispora leptoticha]